MRGVLAAARARSPAGTRVYDSAPGSWKNVTLIAALPPSEVEAAMAFEGATDQQAFRISGQSCLARPRQPEKQSCIAVLAYIGGAVHRENIALRQ